MVGNNCAQLYKSIDKRGRRSDLNVNFPYTPMLKRPSPAKRAKIDEPWNKAQANIGPWHRLFVSSFVEIRSKLWEEAKKHSHWLYMTKSRNDGKKFAKNWKTRNSKKKKVPPGNLKRHILVKFHDDTSNRVGETGRDGRRTTDGRRTPRRFDNLS